MKDSQLLIIAASHVAMGRRDFSCNAILDKSGFIDENAMKLREEYKEIFAPNSREGLTCWLHEEEYKNGLDVYNWRIYALLFFSSMLESEGR